MTSIVIDLKPDCTDPELPEGFTQGERYYQAYIRTRCPAYQKKNADGSTSVGWQCAPDREKWEGVCREIALEAGFTLMRGGFFYRNEQELEKLHFHPDSVSGTMTKNTALRIQAIVEGYPNAFTLRQAEPDLYRPAEHISSEELEKRMAYYADTLKARMLAHYQTGRKVQYAAVSDENLINGLPGLAVHDEIAPGVRLIQRRSIAIGMIRDELVAEGLLVDGTQDGLQGYFRTALKKELPRSKHHKLAAARL